MPAVAEPRSSHQHDGQSVQARFNVFRKFANVGQKLTGRRSRSSAENNNPYPRATRSVDGRPKPYFSQPVLAHVRGSTDDPAPSSSGFFPFSMSRSSFHPRHGTTSVATMTTAMDAHSPPSDGELEPPNSARPSSVRSAPLVGHARLRSGSWRASSSPLTNGPTNVAPSSATVNSGSPTSPAVPDSPSSSTLPRSRAASAMFAPQIPLLPESGGLDIDQDLAAASERVKSSPVAPIRRQTSGILQSPSTLATVGPSTPKIATVTIAEPNAPPRTPARRSTAPRLTSMPIRPISQIMLESSAGRLSPSITMTQRPMPLLNLPLPPTAAQEATPQRPVNVSRLRSMPTLSLIGPAPTEEEAADHDNAELDSDEEDDHGGEGSSAEGTSGSQGRQSRRPARTPMPRIDLASLRPTRAMQGLGSFTATPKAGRLLDYFNAKPPERDPGTTPPQTPPAQVPAPAPERTLSSSPSPISRTQPTPFRRSTMDENRPGLHKRASVSMIDLSTVGKAVQSMNLEEVEEEPAQPAAAAASPARVASVKARASVRKRRSMPIFNASSPPPPYPSFAPFPRATLRRGFTHMGPREEEGAEPLPMYSNGIHLVGVMPRKMEFEAPGVQARDRKWRKVLVELQGTIFRVYEAPSTASGVGLIGEWWERRVGTGDTTVVAPISTVVSTSRSSGGAEVQMEPVPKANDANGEGTSATAIAHAPRPEPVPTQGQQPDTGSRIHRLLHPTRPSTGRSSMDRGRRSTEEPNSRRSTSATSPNAPRSASDSSASGNVSSTSERGGNATSRTSLSSDGQQRSRLINTNVTASPTSPTGAPANANAGAGMGEELHPDPNCLLRAYTMQNAESGLGSDYTKRKNVIRARMEGQQFLLQAPDVAAVVDWIEGLQAAQNIALDLDERPMPKGPLFPRRRRRRVRRPDEASAANNNTQAAASGSTSAAAPRNSTSAPTSS